MRYVMLGKTGIEVSEVGFGCIPIIRLSTDEAVMVLRRAYDRGITLFDTVNGLGERCGIVDTAAVLVNLAVRGQLPWPDGEALQAAADLVDALSGSPRDARRPVTGAHAFTHVAKLHVRAMERDPRAYAWIPERVGRRVRLRE